MFSQTTHDFPRMCPDNELQVGVSTQPDVHLLPWQSSLSRSMTIDLMMATSTEICQVPEKIYSPIVATPALSKGRKVLERKMM